ncbi:EAL and HDOD domain-containing protein [Thiobacter aerophilum]|uniref:HDOD domain-containing protein n=1 Tax=Thiobacter aerophilum TaxID=3121275 RepID=A0ABV0EDS2_9BURK
MLSKYFKLFGGTQKKNRVVPNASAHASEPALDAIVPLLNTPPSAAASVGRVVDTTAANAVVSDVLPIDTHGRRTQVSDLLKRFLGRQPVLEADGRTLGYELRLKKSPPPGAPSGPTLMQMMDEMLLASLLDLNIHALRGGRQIFLPLSVHTLDSGFLTRLAGEGLVLALRPEGDMAALATRLAELKRMGYAIALDEPTLDAATRPLLKLADFLRVDAHGRDAIALGEFAVAALKQSRARLVATHVDVEELFEVCRKLGFKAFQGYSFTRLESTQGARLNPQRLRIMELINLTVSRAEIEDIEAVFKRDAALAYNLLRYINSAANGLMQPVRSIGHALMVLGYDQLYRWLTLLLFASGEPDFRSLALMRTALVRGRFAELLGQPRLAPEARGGLFIVGMFSLLDALLNLPMKQALAGLKLPGEIAQALLEREGPYAPYLELVLATEEGEAHILETYAAVCGIEARELNEAHAQALLWADQVALA